MKLPELKISSTFVAFLEFLVIWSASFLSAMIGGRALSIYGLPPSKESTLKDSIFSFVLNIDTALMSILISAYPEIDKLSGYSNSILI